MTARRGLDRGAKRLLLMAVIACASLLALPAAAQALPEGYHYEMVSPPDKNDGDMGAGNFRGAYYGSPDGERLGYTALGGWDSPSNGVTTPYMATRSTDAWASRSLALPIAPPFFLTSSGVPAISPDFSHSISQSTVDLDTGEPGNGMIPYLYLQDVETGELDRFNIPDADGNLEYYINQDGIAGTPDFSRVVYEADADLTDDGLSPGDRVFIRQQNGDHNQVSVLPNGDRSLGQLPLSSLRAVSSDAEVVYFTTPAAAAERGLYRRDLAAGTTVRVNADENPNEDPPLQDATFSGASADGGTAYFVSSQQLVADDTDVQTDLYRYDHSQPAGSRLTLISDDQNPDDPNGGLGQVYAVSPDGETVIFAHQSQLVPDEPTPAGSKLYIYKDDELQYSGSASGMGTGSSATRTAKLSGDAETFAFNSAGDPLGESPGGQQVYVLDVPNNDMACVTCADGTASGSPTIYESPNIGMLKPIDSTNRAASNEGHVFFQTRDALLPEDTNGFVDVYVWQDGEIDLISTGRSTDNSVFADASVDGSTVFFITREQLSGWDWDNRTDIYAVRTGDSQPEPEAPVQPCQGDDCQGPAPLPPPFTGPGTGEYDGPGNPEFADCSALEADAKAAQQKAKKLKKKAKKAKKKANKASGKKAKKLKKKAKKANKKAKRANKKGKKANRELTECREGAGN